MKRLLLALTLVILSACHRVESGTVVEKWHEPARTWTSMTMIPSGKSFIWIPVTHYDDEDWVVKIQGRDEEGTERTVVWYVEESAYDNVAVGQFISRGTLDHSTQDRTSRTRRK